MESCVGAGDIIGVAVPDAAPIEYGDAPAAAHAHHSCIRVLLVEGTYHVCGNLLSGFNLFVCNILK